MKKLVLNIAAGKLEPIELPNEYILVNLDTMYFQADTPEIIEKSIYSVQYDSEVKQCVFKCNCDVFEFMERTTLQFDEVVCYRFLEHISFTQVLYFIYLVSTVLKPGGTFDCIVPNYETLARMILEESDSLPSHSEVWEEHNIVLTTELLNEPSCPHASIWTPNRVNYFIELEGRFKVSELEESYDFDGRNIYIRFKADRI